MRSTPRLRVFLACAMVWLSALLAACDKPLDVEPSAFAASFYQHLKAKDFGAASAMLSIGMLGTSSREAWMGFMAQVQAELGQLNDVKVKNIEINTVRTGRMFILDISAHYEKANAAETLTLFQGLHTTGLEVVAYDVKAAGLKARVPG